MDSVSMSEKAIRRSSHKTAGGILMTRAQILDRGSYYLDIVESELRHQGITGTDPRHVQAYIESKGLRFGNMPYSVFSREIGTAVAEMDNLSVDELETMAREAGL
jgi:hypothetical protein